LIAGSSASISQAEKRLRDQPGVIGGVGQRRDAAIIGVADDERDPGLGQTW
jgi:hypothetical protein